jgi:ArsR family transcriptional regulator
MNPRTNPVTHPEPLLARVGALADPARLRLLVLLETRELTVSDLGEILQLPQSTVSRHLRTLAEAGWVAARGAGTANLYRMLDGDLAAGARAIWQAAREEVRGWPALAQDRVRLERRLARRRDGGFYAGVAGEWDRLRAELYGDRFTDAALRALLPADWTVADLACGSGSVAALLAPAVARVIAVDLSAEMIAAAKKRLAPFDNVELRRGALEQLPVADESCDAALLLLALTHVAEPGRAVAEMARILKPGGRAVVVDLLRHDRDDFRRRLGQLRNGFDRDELASLLSQAGLAGVSCTTLPPEPEAKGPALLLATGTRLARSDSSRARTARAKPKRRASTRTGARAASPPTPGEELLRAGGRFRARSSSPVRDPFSSSTFCPGAGSVLAPPGLPSAFLLPAARQETGAAGQERLPQPPLDESFSSLSF